MKANYKKTLFFAVSAVASISCSELSFAKEVVVLVDYSVSISDEDWKTYDATFQMALDSLKPGDSIAFAGISADQRGNFRRIASLDVNKTRSRRDEAEQMQMTDDFVGAYINTRDSNKRKAEGTFILSATSGAGDIFRQSAQTEKWLVVLSDMMDSSRESTGMKFLNSPSCAYGDVVANLQKNRLVASLDGVKVFGAGIGGGGMNDRQYTCLQDFWTAYFKKAGASNINISRELKALQ